MTNILAVGDVHADVDRLCDLINQYPDTDYVLQVGDLVTPRTEEDLKYQFSPKRHQQLKSFPDYYKGIKQIPRPTYFIGGNHESWNYLDSFNDGGVLIPNLTYFGRVGRINLDGINVAGISGIYRSGYTESNKRTTAKRLKDRCYFMMEDYDRLDKMTDIDVLLMHEWPTGLNLPENIAERFPEQRSDLMYQWIRKNQPKYVFCGHMHIPFEGKIGESKVYCLSHIGMKGDHKVITL